MIPVIGFGNIEIKGEFNSSDFKEILQLMDESQSPQVFYRVDYDESVGSISFEMEGNKYIDYEPLDKVKQFMLSKKIKFMITVVEYVEGETNYFFDSEDETIQ